MNIITTTNSKLGGQIAQVNMPYCVSCRKDAPCKPLCYAGKGKMNYPNVREGHMKRYEMYLENPVAFFNMIDMEMKFVTYKYFRWHSSGDIVDEQYLDLMCKLARKHKETRFLCFTKKFELVNEYLNHHRKPNNLILCLSSWGNWIPENPHNLPTSWVEFGNESDSNIPEFAYPCSGNCGQCEGVHCWYMTNGQAVKFHKH